MNCAKSDDLFMKYMDNCLSQKEAAVLKEHIKCCDNCKEEFLVYDKMMQEFSHIDIVEAPDDLEIKVMEQIKMLPSLKENTTSLMDTFLYFILGFISVMMGLGVLLMIYKEQIISFLEAKYNTSSIEALKPVTSFTESFIADIAASLSQVLLTVTNIITDYRFFLVGGLTFLAITQYVRTRVVRQKE